MIINEPIFGRKPVEVSRISYEDDDFNATSSMLEALIPLEESFMEITREQIEAMYYGIIDDNIEILEEGLGDTLVKAAGFFNNLVKKFVDLLKKIFMVIRAFIGNFENFIKKYNKKIEEANPDFTIKGYNYDFEASIPRTDRVSAIVQHFNNELSSIDKMSKEDIAKEREEFISDHTLNKIRGEVIGAGGPVTKEDYVSELKKKYRSGTTDPIEIKVDKAYLNKVLNGYSDLKKVLNDTVKEQDRIVLLINSMKTFFERGVKYSRSGNLTTVQAHKIDFNESKSGVNKSETIAAEGTTENYEKLNVFYNFKFYQAKEIGSIVTIALVQKVDALKEALKQYEAVVRKAVFTKSDPVKSVEK